MFFSNSTESVSNQSRQQQFDFFGSSEKKVQNGDRLESGDSVHRSRGYRAADPLHDRDHLLPTSGLDLFAGDVHQEESAHP